MTIKDNASSERRHFIITSPGNVVVTYLTKEEYDAIRWLLTEFDTDIYIESLEKSNLVETIPNYPDWDRKD